MDTKLFLITLVVIFLFLAGAKSMQSPTYAAVGTVELDVPTAPPPPPPPPAALPAIVGPRPTPYVGKVPVGEFAVEVIADDKVEIKGTNLAGGDYFADVSGARQNPFTGVGFTLMHDVSFFKITIENVSRPANVPALEEQYGLERPYQHVKVTVIGADPERSFSRINMDFKVEKEWIEGNLIDEGTIVLYRYEGLGQLWRPVSVIRTGENEKYIYFTAYDVKAFSAYFAISAKGLIVSPVITAPYEVAPMTYMQLALLLFAVFILIILLAKRRRKKEREERMLRKARKRARRRRRRRKRALGRRR